MGPVRDTSKSATGSASCDRCRSRKVKCQVLSDDDLILARARGVGNRCKGCFSADKECTHNYVHKKPGRPLGSGVGTRRRPPATSVSNSPRPASAAEQEHLSPSAITNSLGVPLGLSDLDLQLDGSGSSGPAFGSIFGSARNALYPTSYAPQLFEAEPGAGSGLGPGLSGSGDMGLGGGSELERVFGSRTSDAFFAAPVVGGTGAGGSGVSNPLNGNHLNGTASRLASGSTPGNLNDHGAPPSGKPPSPNPPAGSHSRPSLDAPLSFGSQADGTSVDDILPWADVCYFVSLFLKDQHCLVPLVHKPTFAQDVVSRRDRRDEAFRGLLCSMVAYTICQCPISTMTSSYPRSRLVEILHRCRAAAEAIRHRQRLAPSLILLSSAVLDWITAQAVGNPQVCDLLIAETTRLVHALNLTGSSRSKAGNEVEEQICRRLYWIIYSKDKTDALSGRPIILHDFEGLAPFPLEIDDDYITPVGHLAQPGGRTSYMAGFVTIMRIFQVISQCVARHRTFANRTGDEMEAEAGGEGEERSIRWIEGAQERLRRILEHLPPDLCMDTTVSARAEAEAEAGAGVGDQLRGDFSLFRIQQANISITALCAEFALLDFRASLRPGEDTRAEREEMARKAYETLSSIPLEYLASNGESMRGKVLRIILALLHMTTEPVAFSQNVWDWWNMYSRVQFLQVIPDETMILLDQSAPRVAEGGAVVSP